ncbi:MAG: 50S ribosomal protein L11 methyltransferase [Ignavibacteria bacterium]|nr:50S ribosomal protein L11 methyltransferase [Ignavibacteria bacterium]
MPRRYVLFSMSIPEEESDLAMGVLSLYPITGVELKTDMAIACFDQVDWSEGFESAIITDLRAIGVHANYVKATVEEDQNWNAEWESSINPIVVNENIVIVPEWKSNAVSAPIKLIISPKMSFGTGHHSTTRMMCRLMERYVRTSSTWVDVGTGTGVLAILAAKLGAANVYAFDNDEWSILNAKENIERNGCQEIIQLEQKELGHSVLPKCDGIAANLYRHLVIPFANTFIQALNSYGVIIVSGILSYDFEDVIKPFVDSKCTIEEKLTEGEWCAVAIVRP